jgi:hypothetical protein
VCIGAVCLVGVRALGVRARPLSRSILFLNIFLVGALRWPRCHCEGILKTVPRRGNNNPLSRIDVAAVNASPLQRLELIGCALDESTATALRAGPVAVNL